MKKVLFCFINFIIVGLIGLSLVYYPAIPSAGVPAVSFKWYIAWIICTLAISATLGFLEYKTDYYEKFFSALWKNRKNIVSSTVILALSAILSVGVEYIVSHLFFGINSVGTYFNRFRYYYIVAILFVLIFIIYHTLCKTISVEKAFVGIAVAAGAVMILCSPSGHTCWDADSHYKFALGESSIHANVSSADMDVIAHRGVYAEPSQSAAEFENNTQLLNERDKICEDTTVHNFSIPHIPTAIAFAVSRLFGWSFYTKACLAKFVNLIMYTLLVYFAIKKLKSGKMIYFVIALFPNCLFLAANIDYDWWVNGFTMLGMAYFFGEVQQPQKRISVWESVVMCGSLFLALLPKQVYFPLLLLPFFLKKDYFRLDKNAKRRHFIICFAALALLLISFIIRSVTSIGGGGDIRGGTDVNSQMQIKYILSYPFVYAGTLIKFLWGYFSFSSLSSGICSYAYLDVKDLFAFASFPILIMLIIAVFTDKNEYDAFSSTVKIRTVSYLVAVVCLALIPTALYISFTGVGSSAIRGCQSRYIFPLYISLLPVMGSYKIQNKMNRQIYNMFFALVMSAAIFSSIYFAMIDRML